VPSQPYHVDTHLRTAFSVVCWVIIRAGLEAPFEPGGLMPDHRGLFIGRKRDG
jgi:hypothetical protein